MKNYTILCVDDDVNLVNALKVILRQSNYEVFTATDGFEALNLLKEKQIDIAIVDYKMPRMNGVELLKKIKAFNRDIEVLILTGCGTIPNAVECIKIGATDYIIKPFQKDDIIKRVKKLSQSKTEVRDGVSSQPHRFTMNNLIGKTPEIVEIFNTIRKIADSDSTVLILGETGTGKGEIAKAIHYGSSRAHKKFRVIDCASINPNLFESELFGHMKGAFTGAVKNKIGLFRTTGGGTLFLDEIADIPQYVQVKLLRSIEEKEYRPVGGIEAQKFTARIIAATNKNLYDALEKNEFRKDLFYRLSVVLIELPPLRERKSDIPLLVDFFIKKYDRDHNLITGITDDALNILMRYDWPGNIRELENCIERAFSIGAKGNIDVKDLPQLILTQGSAKSLVVNGDKTTLSDYEKEVILNALNDSAGNKRRAARYLNIGIATLYRKLKKYNLN